MARKAYKPLYLAALARYEDERHRHVATTRRLKEIEEALIPFGETVVGQIEPGDSAIELEALSFIALRTLIEAGSRIVGDQGYAEHYLWRGRPLHKIAPGGR